MNNTTHYDASQFRKLETSPTIIPDSIDESHKAHLASYYITDTKMGQQFSQHCRAQFHHPKQMEDPGSPTQPFIYTYDKNTKYQSGTRVGRSLNSKERQLHTTQQFTMIQSSTNNSLIKSILKPRSDSQQSHSHSPGSIKSVKFRLGPRREPNRGGTQKLQKSNRKAT